MPLPASLPDDARLWVFTADRPLSDDEAARLLERVRTFLERWASHGRPVPAAAALLHGRFLAVGAHIEQGATNAGVSGCGIDSLTHAVDEAGAALGLAWAGGLEIAYEDAEGAVQVVPRRAFRQRARAGEVNADTMVFVTTLDTVGALRREGLRRRAADAWHGRVFRLAADASA